MKKGVFLGGQKKAIFRPFPGPPKRPKNPKNGQKPRFSRNPENPDFFPPLIQTSGGPPLIVILFGGEFGISTEFGIFGILPIFGAKLGAFLGGVPKSVLFSWATLLGSVLREFMPLAQTLFRTLAIASSPRVIAQPIALDKDASMMQPAVADHIKRAILDKLNK